METTKKSTNYSFALDLVEDGKDIHIKEIKNQLPPNVTSKMLYKDIVKIAWPSVVELTLTQLASMVDLMVVRFGSTGTYFRRSYNSA